LNRKNQYVTYVVIALKRNTLLKFQIFLLWQAASYRKNIKVIDMLHLLPLTTKFFFFLEKVTAPTAAMCPAATARHDPVEAFQILTCKLTLGFTSEFCPRKTPGGRGL